MAVGLELNQSNPDVTVNTMTMGYLSKAVTGGNVVLTDSEQEYAMIEFTGTLASNATIQTEDGTTNKWFIKNSTSGAFTLTVETLNVGTVGFVVPQGESRYLFTGDGITVEEVQMFSPGISDSATSTILTLTNTDATVAGDFEQNASTGDSVYLNSSTINESNVAFGLDATFTRLMQYNRSTGAWAFGKGTTKDTIATEFMNFDSNGNATFAGDITSSVADLDISNSFAGAANIDHEFTGATTENVSYRFGRSTSTSGNVLTQFMANTSTAAATINNKTGDITTIGNIIMADTKGIDFSANTDDGSGTVSAELLDDYEEGTFSPGISCGTPGDLSVTYTTNDGYYTKVGNMVRFSLRIVTATFTHTTASGSFQITGLPFTSRNTSNAHHTFPISTSPITAAAGVEYLTVQLQHNQAIMNILGNKLNGAARVTGQITEYATTSTVLIEVTGTYEV